MSITMVVWTRMLGSHDTPGELVAVAIDVYVGTAVAHLLSTRRSTQTVVAKVDAPSIELGHQPKIALPWYSRKRQKGADMRRFRC